MNDAVLTARMDVDAELSPADERRVARELSPSVAWPTLAMAVLLPAGHWTVIALGWTGLLPLWVCAGILTITAYAHYTLVHESIHGNLAPGHPRLRGLNDELAKQVAVALTAHDALGAHARDELGLAEMHRARPLQAAMASAATFSVGAALPLLAAVLLPLRSIPLGASIGSLLFLILLGAIGAKAGGAPILRGTIRVTFWGAIAMAATYAIGSLFGTSVG